MYCTNCGALLPEGTRVCPNCAAEAALQAQATGATEQYGSTQPNQSDYQQPGYQQPGYQQQGYQQPMYPPFNAQGYNPNYPFGQPFYAQQGVAEIEIKSTRTLGIVAIIVGLFVPLVGYICGGIGISKVRKLSVYATPEQRERLDRNKVLCILGIVIPAVINIGLVIVRLINH